MIWVGEITNEHGTNLYAGTSEEAVRRQFADYCIAWWDDNMEGEEMPDNDDDLITMYFDNVDGESYGVEYVNVYHLK